MNIFVSHLSTWEKFPPLQTPHHLLPHLLNDRLPVLLPYLSSKYAQFVKWSEMIRLPIITLRRQVLF